LALQTISIHAVANDGKRTVPFVDGMTIHTEKVAGTIEVRSQSLGPGGCATRYIAGTHSIDILAPPFTWSDWSELTSHVGSVSLALRGVVLCDTGTAGAARLVTLPRTLDRHPRSLSAL
jgi:hypothetical protein